VILTMKSVTVLFRYLVKPEFIIGLLIIFLTTLYFVNTHTINNLRMNQILLEEEQSRLIAERDFLRESLDKQNKAISSMRNEQLTRNRDSLTRVRSIFETSDFIKTPPGAQGMNEWFSKSFR
jgi:hypothetical protein